MTDAAPDPAPKIRRSLGRRLAFVVVVLLVMESIGWLGDFVHEYRRRLLSTLALMRLETQPATVLNNTANHRDVFLRDPRDGPGSSEPYRIGGVLVKQAGPWLGEYRVTPGDVVRDDEHRIVVLGGSAAFGFPYRFDDTFAGILARQFSQEPIRVLNASRVGWTSSELTPLVEHVVRFYRPDVVILFVDNNEWFHWQPPPGPNTVKAVAQVRVEQSRETLSQTSINILRSLAHSRFLAAVEYSLVRWQAARRRDRQDLARKNRSRDRFEAHHELTGSRYAVEMPHPADRYDPAEWLTARRDYLETFRSNLERMVRSAADHDVEVILLTMPFNYRLSPAWKHRQPHAFLSEHRETVTRAVADGSRQVETGRFANGLETVSAALALDPHPAVLHYLKAQCLEGLARPLEAEVAYADSRERMMGNLGGRLSTNRIVRDVATRHRLPLVDVKAMFDEYGHARRRYYNLDLIHDDCHPTPRGHRLIAEALLPLLREMIPLQ